MNTKIFKSAVITSFISSCMLMGCNSNRTNDETNSANQMNALNLTSEWDKTFPKSDKVNHSKITFHNRYGITLAADLYTPVNASGKLPAIAVSGPFGAVKEQSSGLYAQQLAERGFLTIAFDPSYTGESGGEPRYVASPDINTDPRIKATVASTMYDMTRVNANGYFDSENTAEQRNFKRAAMVAQRTEDYKSGFYKSGGGVVSPLPDDAPRFVKDYYAYYKTPRGYHKRSLNSNNGWNVTSNLPFLNFKFFDYADELESAVMIVHGDKAHSFYFGKDTYALLKGDNKEFVVVAGANHTDLYDGLSVIPFDKIESFFNENLK